MNFVLKCFLKRTHLAERELLDGTVEDLLCVLQVALIYLARVLKREQNRKIKLIIFSLINLKFEIAWKKGKQLTDSIFVLINRGIMGQSNGPEREENETVEKTFSTASSQPASWLTHSQCSHLKFFN